MIITISGYPGSGKTTTGKLLAEKLNCNFYSMGDLRRKMAQERGMTITKLNEIGEKEEWTDKEVDEYQKKLSKKEKDFIVEGRLSFHFIPESIKIFLEVSPGIGAKRIFDEKRKSEDKKENIKDVMEMLDKRVKSDKRRYLKYYNIDCYNKNKYSIVIDTTKLKVEETVNKILDELNKK